MRDRVFIPLLFAGFLAGVACLGFLMPHAFAWPLKLAMRLVIVCLVVGSQLVLKVF